MKNRIIILLSAFLISSGFTYAQKDERATPILNKVSATYKSIPCLQSEFTLKILEPEGELADEQKGSITLQGEKYLLELSEQKIISNGLAVWTYHADINEVQIEEAEAGDGTITPSKIFTMYEEGFKYKYVGEKTSGGKKYHRIDLFPEDTEKPYFKVEISIDAKENIINSASIHDKNGSKYVYEINSFKKMEKLGDDAFAFSTGKYPGIEVVDLR